MHEVQLGFLLAEHIELTLPGSFSVELIEDKLVLAMFQPGGRVGHSRDEAWAAWLELGIFDLLPLLTDIRGIRKDRGQG